MLVSIDIFHYLVIIVNTTDCIPQIRYTDLSLSSETLMFQSQLKQPASLHSSPHVTRHDDVNISLPSRTLSSISQGRRVRALPTPPRPQIYTRIPLPLFLSQGGNDHDDNHHHEHDHDHDLSTPQAPKRPVQEVTGAPRRRGSRVEKHRVSYSS